MGDVSSGDLVGRDNELGGLFRFLADPGRGVVFVFGEPGIGKTALVSHVRNVAAPDLALTVHCNEFGSAPYAPLLAALDDELAIGSHAGGDLVPAMTTLASVLRAESDLDEVTSRLGAAEHHLAQVARRVLALGAAGYCLLVVENLHWADRATRRLIGHLAQEAERLTLPIIVTSRVPGGEVATPLSSGVRQRVDLRALDTASVAALATRQLGGEVSPRLASDLMTWSGGNPFVLEALISRACSDGLLVRRIDGWVGEALPVDECPPELAAWFLGQHADIDAPTWRVLELAALIGERVDPQVLRTAAGLAPRDDACLERVEASGLLGADTDGRTLVFRHALVRSAIESRISVVRRRELHDEIARALASQTPDAAVDRARHLVAAGHLDRAAPFQLQAATAALRACSYGEARDLLLGLVDVVQGSAKGRALCQLALALRQLGDSQEAVAAAARGIGLLEAEGLIELAGQERLMLGLYLFETDGPTLSRREYERARDQLEPFGDSAALALSYVWCGAALVVGGDCDAARPEVMRGLEMAERLGVRSVVAWAHQFLGMIEAKAGHFDQGIDLLDRSYRDGVEQGADLLAERALQNACAVRVIGLRAREVESRLAQHTHPLDAGAWPTFRDVALLGALIELGELDRSLRLARTLRQRLERSGAAAILRWIDSSFVALLADCGQPDEARTVMGGSFAGLSAQDLGFRVNACIRFMLVVGDTAAAAGLAAEALAAADDLGLHLVLALRAAEAFVAGGQTAELSRLSAAVEAAPGIRGTAWAELLAGQAQLMSGSRGDAERTLARAASRFVSASYRVSHARCLAMQAIAVGTHLEYGSELFAEAMTLLADLGAAGMVTELRRLEGSLREPNGHDRAPLSPREQDLLRLVARGLTDAQIAVALSISPRTVGSHLDRIRDKTGCRRRAELTRLTIELGLLPAKS